MTGVAEGTSDPQFVTEMMWAEYRSQHSERDMDEAPISVIRMNYHYAIAKERRLARKIAIEVSKLFGSSEDG